MAQRRRSSGFAIAVFVGLGVAGFAPDASACGGLFCSTRPVDQTAERVLFEVDDDSVTMTTQISFSGKSEDFAWVLPLSEPPAPDSLEVFSQSVLNWLDTSSGPSFPPACPGTVIGLPCVQCASAGLGDAKVEVYLRAEVGSYQVSVVGSEDPAELVRWLRDAGYRITPAMEPYVALYAAEGMKFLALKLLDTASVQDIRPFRFTVPGTSPSIPLRMTALAAEPEMSIVTFVLAAQRYEGKNWQSLELSDTELRYNPFGGFPPRTNWSTLVARAADAAGGQGWVTEYAGPSAGYVAPLEAQLGRFPTPDDERSAQQLLGLLQKYPYLTRVYSRLSAEEMTSDPVFGKSALGDVTNLHTLSPLVAGIEQCSDDIDRTDPCDFTNCGAAGLCRPAPVDLHVPPASPAGCACLPGATARVTLGAYGAPEVVCQDGRLSFLNPGDRETDDAEALPDPCAGYSCGHGQCVSMNLTPTCVCDQGFIAIGRVDSDGARLTSCVEPASPVPLSFYDGRLPALPEGLPGGRLVAVPEPLPSNAAATEAAGFPMPPASDQQSAGCALPAPGTSEQLGLRWVGVALALAGLGRRWRRQCSSERWRE